MDSVDFAALDFFVGAICRYRVLGEVGGGVKHVKASRRSVDVLRILGFGICLAVVSL